MLLLLSAGGLAEAKIFDASPDGTPYSIGSALAEAGPGDTVVLADGEYDEAIVTVQGGERGNPLTITGGRSAVINAEYHGRVVLVQHSWVTIEGFTVDGKIADADEAASYANKGVFVDSGNTSGDETLEGFVMREMSIINCGDECVRLKNFVVGAELSYNEISNCGVRDFVYGNSGKNGEGIYVGTSSTQWDDGPDGCSDILISRNVITPNGNECVDIKEGSTGVIGDGSWFSIELPEAEVVSGMKLWFEDSDERQASFSTVCIGEGEVVIQEDESSMVEEGVGQFFPFREAMLIKSIMIVGYGNTINDWNSVNEIQLCRGDAESSRKLLGRYGADRAGRATGEVAPTMVSLDADGEAAASRRRSLIGRNHG
eukprot:g15219.t1